MLCNGIGLASTFVVAACLIGTNGPQFDIVLIYHSMHGRDSAHRASPRQLGLELLLLQGRGRFDALFLLLELFGNDICRVETRLVT